MGEIKCSFIKFKDGSSEFICVKDVDKKTSIACAVNNDDVDGKFVIKEKVYTCDTDPKTDLPLQPVAKTNTTAFVGDDAFRVMVEKLKGGTSLTATRVKVEDGKQVHVFKLGAAHSGAKADATVVVRQGAFNEEGDGNCPGTHTQESFMIFIDGDNINCSLVNKK